MTKRTAVTTAALSTLAVLLAGCVLPAKDLADDPTDEPAPSVSARPSPSSSQCDLERCGFTYDTMDQYVEAVVPSVEAWVEKNWPGMGLPNVVYIKHGQSGRSGCGDGTGKEASYDDESYFYCGPDNKVYVGQDTVWLFFSKTGDAGPAMGLAHEYGHHVQHKLGLRSPRTSQESIDYENQADCLSGTWAKYMNDQDLLDYPDDLNDIDKLMPMIASAEDDIDRDHGTIAEREAAFNAGFTRGVSACGVNPG